MHIYIYRIPIDCWTNQLLVQLYPTNLWYPLVSIYFIFHYIIYILNIIHHEIVGFIHRYPVSIANFMFLKATVNPIIIFTIPIL